jgi:hypothetical protein
MRYWRKLPLLSFATLQIAVFSLALDFTSQQTFVWTEKPSPPNASHARAPNMVYDSASEHQLQSFTARSPGTVSAKHRRVMPHQVDTQAQERCLEEWFWM